MLSYQERSPSSAFFNRIAKARVFQRVSGVLPEMAEKKAEVIERIPQSPRTRGVLQMKGIMNIQEEQGELTTLRGTGSWHC